MPQLVVEPPSRNPRIPPPDSSPIAMLPKDLLITLIDEYFGMNIFDLITLRLVCKRWKEAIGAMRRNVDLVSSGVVLARPSCLSDMLHVLPNIRQLRIAFVPKAEVSPSFRYHRKRHQQPYAFSL